MSEEHLRSDPLDPDPIEAAIGPTGVSGTAMFFHQMVQFDPLCADYMGYAMDWVLGEAIEVFGKHLVEGDKLKHDVIEDKRWYLHNNSSFIAAMLADAHTILPDRGYLEAAKQTLLWIGAELLPLAEGIWISVEHGMHTPINQSLVEGLTGVGFNGLRIFRLHPGTEAGEWGNALSNVVANTLVELAVDDPVTGGKMWPLSWNCSGPQGLTTPKWCAGAGGIVDFFLEKYDTNHNPTYEEIAVAGLTYIQGTVTAMMAAQEISAAWGNGVSGLISQFLRAYRILGDVTYFDFAETMGDYLLEQAIITEHGLKFFDSNMHCQHGNIGVVQGLDDLVAESEDPRYLATLNQLIDHMYATQVRSEYGTVIPAYEDSNFTCTGQGWGQASLLLPQWGEPDVVQNNPKYLNLCENLRDFLLETRIEEPSGWKWQNKIYYTIADPTAVAGDDYIEGLPRVSLTVAPNPANPSRNNGIRFQVVPNGAPTISLRIYDLRGRLVRTLADNELIPSPRTLEWNGHDRNGRRVASGVYFYEVAGPDMTARKKLVLTR